jgi:peptide/nickel transport system substrate-binding protein
MTKIIVAVVVIIVIIAAIAGALLLTGGKTTEKVAPTASLTASASLVDEATAVVFNASASKGQNGATISYYLWNFGDGTTGNTTTPTVTHTYTGTAGLYQVVVKVVDNNGMSATSWAGPAAVQVLVPEIPATVTNATAPTPVVTVDNQVIKTGAVVKFTGNGSIGYDWETPTGSSALVDHVTWDFGDGSATVTGNLSVAGFQAHTYAGNGTVFVAKLTVVSTHSASADYRVTIVVVPPTITTGNIKNPDTFTSATIGEPQTLDPAWDYETAGGEILQNCYETLVFYDGGSLTNLKPVLCTQIPTVANGGISADGLNYTFTVRQNVKFHDGTIMTTDDVVYSFKRMLIMDDVEGAAWMYGQFMLPTYPGLGDPSNISTAEVDAAITSTATTVTFHLIQPCPAWLYILAFQAGSVVEKAWVQAHTPGTSTEVRWVNGGFQNVQVPQQYLKGGGNGYIDRNVMGTGPYMLKTWAPNQYIVMQRWDSYWGVKPALKFIVIQKVQDVGTREMLLLSGQADLVYIPRQNTQDVRNKAGVRIVEGLPTLEIDFFGMNEQITPHLDIGNIPSNFYADVHIRQAMVHAFDYNKFLTNVWQNTAVQPNGPIPTGMLGYDPAVPNVTFDLSISAAQLNLAQNPLVPGSSYADTGFHIVLYYNAGAADRQAGCQLLKDGLEALSQNTSAGVAGQITVDVVALDWPTYLDARTNRWLPMFFLGWLVDYPDPDDFANPFCHEAGAFPVRLGIVNHTLTSLVEQGAVELNQTARIQIYAQITQSCYDNAYYLWTTQPTTFHVERTWVQGYTYNPAFAGQIFSYYSKG